MNVTAFLLAIFLPKFSLCCPSSKESKETNKQSKESVCSSNNPCQNDGECIDKEVKIDAKVICILISVRLLNFKYGGS